MIVKPLIHEEIIKAWTDAQKRLWESLCSAMPFQPPTGVEIWRETYLKNLASWETAVKRTLEKEAAWVEEWVQRVAREKGTPEIMASWVQQMNEVLHRWIQTQNHWWNEYFALLRRGGVLQPDSSDQQLPTAVVVEFPTVVPEVADIATTAAAGSVKSVNVTEESSSKTEAIVEPVESTNATEEPSSEAKPVADAEPWVKSAQYGLKRTSSEAKAITDAEPVALTNVTTEESSFVESEPAHVADEPPAIREQPSELSKPMMMSTVDDASELSLVSAPEGMIADTMQEGPSLDKRTDDLKLINGIGPALEKKLNANGVFSFRDLAMLNEADIERIEAAIKFAGRIHREDWIGQARMQHLRKYQEQL